MGQAETPPIPRGGALNGTQHAAFGLRIHDAIGLGEIFGPIGSFICRDRHELFRLLRDIKTSKVANGHPGLRMGH
jgi:hypothetical protein